MAGEPSDIPILAFWDFTGAFPSVMHEWIFPVIHFYQLPAGMINIISGIYFVNWTCLQVDSVTICLYFVLFVWFPV